MIFVTIGTSSWDFIRLIREMDRIAGGFDEEVIMQISDTNYKPKNAKYFSFISKEENEELYKKARVVVCHAGVGSIVTALKYNKLFLVVPRQKKFDECPDDHQIRTARELEKEEKIKVVYNIEELEDALKGIKTNHKKFSKDKRLTLALKNYITSIDKKY